MKRTAIALTLISALLVSTISGAILANLAKANGFFVYLPEIVIKSDGSVEPETEFIRQTGNVYALTANLSQKYAIKIQCSNIVFDGGGHFINGTVSYAGYANIGIVLENVTNVTVKNIRVSGFSNRDIALLGCTNCSILRVDVTTLALGYSELGKSFSGCDFNTVAESIFGSLDLLSFNNIITMCTHTNWSPIYITGGANIFFENNFGSKKSVWLVGGYANSWDNGVVGNYWGDFSTRYPNASEIDNSGVGDTAYVIDADNIDYYPLMAPVDNVAPSIEVLSPQNKVYNVSSIPLDFGVKEAVTPITYSLDGEANITISGNTTLTGLVNGDHNLTVYAWDEAGNVGTSEAISFTVDVPFPTALVITASGASIAVIGIGLLIYFKKRKHQNIPSSTISNNK